MGRRYAVPCEQNPYESASPEEVQSGSRKDDLEHQHCSTCVCGDMEHRHCSTCACVPRRPDNQRLVVVKKENKSRKKKSVPVSEERKQRQSQRVPASEQTVFRETERKNAGRAADGAQLDPECSCCHDGPDTARHVLLRRQALKGPREEMWELVIEIWTEAQQNEFAAMKDQQQYMTLLGKQMTNGLDTVQQSQLDTTDK
jgi:hypothetical protein